MNTYPLMRDKQKSETLEDNWKNIAHLHDIWTNERIMSLVKNNSNMIKNIQENQTRIHPNNINHSFENISVKIAFLKEHMTGLIKRKIDYRETKNWRWKKFGEYCEKLKKYFPRYTSDYLSRFALYKTPQYIQRAKYKDYPSPYSLVEYLENIIMELEQMSDLPSNFEREIPVYH